MKKIASVNDIPEGRGIIVLAPEGYEIALFNVNGEIFALENACPHMGGPLAEGDISCEDSKYTVTCPWHGWEFDVCSGVCENVSNEQAKKIKIVVKDGDVYLPDSN